MPYPACPLAAAPVPNTTVVPTHPRSGYLALVGVLLLGIVWVAGCSMPERENAQYFEQFRVPIAEAGVLELGEPERVSEGGALSRSNGMVAIPIILDPTVWNSTNPAVVTSVESYVNEEWNRIFFTLVAIKSGRIAGGNRPRILSRLRPGEYEVYYMEPDGIHRSAVTKVRIGY